MKDIQTLREKTHDKKVLFVDDEEKIREMTGNLLNKFFDNVIICKDGIEGLEAFKINNDFDIVIADIQMPRMDGVTMVKKIQDIKADIYVIFITASRGDIQTDKSQYDMYITKPISYEDIKEIINNVSEL
ncbi:MAG: response regulator [Campylobacterota bacterium]|nr:response regulator [Campylobacterota bacterium]